MHIRVADILNADSPQKLRAILVDLHDRLAAAGNVPKIVGRVVRRAAKDADMRPARALALALLPAAKAAGCAEADAAECDRVMDAFEVAFGDPDANILEVKG